MTRSCKAIVSLILTVVIALSVCVQNVFAEYTVNEGDNIKVVKVGVGSYSPSTDWGWRIYVAEHMRRMKLRDRRIGIQDLAPSKIKEIDRVAVVAGIPEGKFGIYNSKHYRPENGAFKVCDHGVKKEEVHIMTKTRPELKFGENKGIPGVIRIEKTYSNGITEVAINKRYCRLCNKYVVVASIKRPEFHLGMNEIVTIDGSIVYVFGKDIAPSGRISYSMGTQRVYISGYIKANIEGDIDTVTKYLYKMIDGVFVEREAANKDFKMIADYDCNIEDDVVEQIENEITE